MTSLKEVASSCHEDQKGQPCLLSDEEAYILLTADREEL
jgi:hypothetical protein